IVPPSFVNRVLPLSISPAPIQTTRVFVGRLELVTEKTRSAIATALASGDEKTLARYNRFLQPMLEILLQRETDPLLWEMFSRRWEDTFGPELPEEFAATAPRNGRSAAPLRKGGRPQFNPVSKTAGARVET